MEEIEFGKTAYEMAKESWDLTAADALSFLLFFFFVTFEPWRVLSVDHFSHLQDLIHTMIEFQMQGMHAKPNAIIIYSSLIISI